MVPGGRIGNYRIDRELGTSGAGMLYAVSHVVLPRRAIIRVMHAAVIEHGRLAVQLLREACILEALCHPGIPRLYESGMLPDRRPWFAVEYIDGDSLADVLAEGPLPADEVVLLIRDLAEVLEHAHRRGVIHRSLRPERIRLVDGHGRSFRLCIDDWSDARTHDAASRIPHIPTLGARVYLAPELVRGDLIDDRADVYALGVIAYQALAGTFPMPGVETPAESPFLTNLIEQMLAPDRFDRPTSSEVRAALDALAVVHEPAEVVLVETAETVEAADVQDAPRRIRKLRWTPAYGHISPEDPDEFAPEITPDPS